MKFTKLKIFMAFFLGTSLSLGLMTATIVSAQDIVNPVDENFSDIPSALESATTWGRLFATVVYFAAMSYGGFLKVANPSNPEKQQQAVQVWTAATFGYVVIILAPFIISSLGGILGADTGIQT